MAILVLKKTTTTLTAAEATDIFQHTDEYTSCVTVINPKPRNVYMYVYQPNAPLERYAWKNDGLQWCRSRQRPLIVNGRKVIRKTYEQQEIGENESCDAALHRYSYAMWSKSRAIPVSSESNILRPTTHWTYYR